MDYLKTRLFGSTSEIRHEQLPGQLDLFHLQTEDEPEPVPLEVEYIEVKAHKKARKSNYIKKIPIQEAMILFLMNSWIPVRKFRKQTA